MYNNQYINYHTYHNSQLSILNSQLNKLQFIPVPIRIIFLRTIFYNLLPIHFIKIFSYICRNSPRCMCFIPSTLLPLVHSSRLTTYFG